MIEKLKDWLKSHTLWRLAIRPTLRVQLEQLNTAKPTVFYLGLPEHGNLGDQAIAKATEIYLQEQLPQHQVVRIANDAVLPCIPLLKRIMQPNHLIVMHGGGNLGDLWPGAESVRRAVVKRLKKWPIIQLPQSVFFIDKQEHTLSKKCYDDADRLVLVAREEQARSAMQQAFTCPSMLVPDMVFTLSGRLKELPIQREGVMVLFRHDVEKLYNDNVRDGVIDQLGDLFDRVTLTDTVLPTGVPLDQRDDVLIRFWRQMAKHELVVTDRLHGMIFGLITQTPTVALLNNNGKIISTFETWLQSVPWIKVWAPTDGPLEVAIVDVMRAPVAPVDFSRQFRPLNFYLANFRKGE